MDAAAAARAIAGLLAPGGTMLMLTGNSEDPKQPGDELHNFPWSQCSKGLVTGHSAAKPADLGCLGLFLVDVPVTKPFELLLDLNISAMTCEGTAPAPRKKLCRRNVG